MDCSLNTWIAIGQDLTRPAPRFKDPYSRRTSTRGFRKTKTRGNWKVAAVIILSLVLLAEINFVQSVQALDQSNAITAALNWLMLNQQSNGSYGSFTEPQTAPAAYAIW